MSFNIQKKSAIENIEKYFCHFNYKLYENHLFTESDNDNSSDGLQNLEEDTSANSSSHSLEIVNFYNGEEEEKYIPFHLLESTPSEKKINHKEEETSGYSQSKDIPSPHKILFDTEEKNINLKRNDIKPELQKFLLPKSLFDNNKKKIKKEKNLNDNIKNCDEEKSSINKLDLLSRPFIPKKSSPSLVYITFGINSYKKGIEKLSFPKDLNSNSMYRENKKKKKKKEFVEREGDWSCYRCKNLNFSFRVKCNKCGFPREESEKKFNEVGEQLLKLADLSIYDKKSNKKENKSC